MRWSLTVGGCLAALWIMTTCVVAAADPLALSQLDEIREQTAVQTQVLATLNASRLSWDKEVARLAAQLASEESDPGYRSVDADVLRSVQADLDKVRLRVGLFVARIKGYRLQVRTLNGMIAESSVDWTQADGSAAEAALPATTLHLLRKQVRVIERLIESLHALEQISRRRQSLLEERLRLLQDRLGEDSFRLPITDTQDQRVLMLESVITDYLRQSQLLHIQEMAVTAEDAAALAQRSRLAQQADEALRRAGQRQNDIDLIRTERRLDALSALREDDLVSAWLLKRGAARLDEIKGQLDQIDAALDAQGKILESQRKRFAKSPGSDSDRFAQIKDQEALLDLQRRDLLAAQARLQVERQAYQRVLGDYAAASFLERHALPSTPQDWARLVANARALPQQAGDGLRVMRALVAADIAATCVGDWTLIAGGSLALTLGLLWGRRVLARRCAERQALSGAALARVLPGLIPIGVCALTGAVFGTALDDLLPLLLLLGLWPAQSFILDLTRRVLAARAAASADADAALDARNRRLLRSLTLGLVPSVLVTGLYILARTLPVAPMLGDLLDRLAMIGLLTLVLPAVAARRLLLRPEYRSTPERGLRAAFPLRLVQVLPAFLLLTGLLGLLGFTEFAWAILSHVGWAAAMGLVLALMFTLLADLYRRLDARLAASGSLLKSLWRSHFLAPGYRAAQLAAGAAAGWGLYGLWDWNAETPLVRWLHGALATKLVSLGGAVVTPADVVAALLLVGSALWIGGWTNQVSYDLAYRKVRDAGLRRALANFSQYVVILCGILIALKTVGFDLTALTVFAASLGVGIGLGLQSLANNLISGLLILGERPLRVGDYVTIGQHQGQVAQIGIRSLTLNTDDHQDVIIPNGAVIGNTFVNWTRSDSVLRQSCQIGIGYGADCELAMRQITEILAADPQVLAEPAPAVYLWEYTEKAITIRFQYYIDIRDGLCEARVRSGILLELGRRFAANDIGMPNPFKETPPMGRRDGELR